MNPTRRLPSDFSESAAYPLYAIDPAQDRAWALHFDREDYRRASFLDQRALQHRNVSGWILSGAELRAAAEPPAPGKRLHWLFHIGHCGSSLVSRLLDLVPGVLGLREPLPLLTLAHEPAAERHPWLPTVRSLLARGFDDTDAVVVKPTSIVATLAPALLHGTGQACFLWVDLRTWLATLLRDEGLVNATLATEPLRLAGAPAMSEAATPATRLARAWLIEQLRWRQLASGADAPRILDLDFAALIARPSETMAALAGHFSLALPGDWEARVAASGVLTRYAKDATQAFDADTRRRELAEASSRHAAAIAEGLQWARAEIARQDATAIATRLQTA